MSQALFYTLLGYACFLALYALALTVEDADFVAQASPLLYLAGSLLFLAGSAALVRATLPPPAPMLFRKLSYWEKMCTQYSLLDQQSSLFWGSITFLLGSFLFSMDAAWGIVSAESKPELLSLFSISAGYAFFTIGRVYFLWGSTTANCDVFLRGGGWGYAWCAMLLPSTYRKHSKCKSTKVSPQDGNSPNARLTDISSTILSANSGSTFKVVAMNSDAQSAEESKYSHGTLS